MVSLSCWPLCMTTNRNYLNNSTQRTLASHHGQQPAEERSANHSQRFWLHGNSRGDVASMRRRIVRYAGYFSEMPYLLLPRLLSVK